MPIAMLQEFPGDVESYNRVNEVLRPHENPPEGLIFHTAAPYEGGMRVFDVWRSREDLERFLEQRLRPAMVEAAGAQAGPPTRQEVYDLHDFIAP